MNVIEFMGMPKAGKTTAIEVAESYLKKEGKNVRVVYEGARISPLDKKDRFLYNSWSFHNTLNKILESKLNPYDFILIDRGVYDHIAFSRANEIFCNKKDSDIAGEYYEIFGNLEDRIFLYMLEPEEAIKREGKHNPFLGRIFNREFLENLYSSYENLYSKLLLKRDITLVEGGNSLNENTSGLISYFKNLCREKILEGV